MKLKETPIATLLAELDGAPLPEKVAAIQEIYERVAYSPTGIIYSMQRLADGDIRPFRAKDFDGTVGINPAVGRLEIDGTWDFLHGENSITNSGIYLAAQAYRIQVEDTPESRDEAAKAFNSLEIIFEMGVSAGKPGWMCKPYGFRPSTQTSPDQYSDACWGLWTYHAVAPPVHRRKIEVMLVAFADYWRDADYIIHYFEHTWSFRNERGYSNATMLLINALAYHITGIPVYLREAEWFRDHADWVHGSIASDLRRRIEQEAHDTGQVSTYGNDVLAPFATPLLRSGEVLFWEAAILCKYVVVAAEIIYQVLPDLLDGLLPGIIADWWSQGKYSIGDDLLPYYWIAADFRAGTWRPLPTTEALPREQWAFGDPFMARTSEVRWCEPLARSLVTSVIAAQQAQDIAGDATQQARRILDAVNDTRLHWIVDPDGRQLMSEVSYYGQCLSSEMPASVLAAYWRGLRDGLW